MALADTKREVFQAIRRGDIPHVANAIAKGKFDPNETNVSFQSALTVAAEAGQENMAFWLIEQGADIHHTNAKSMGPLHYACRSAPNLARYLVEQGIDPNTPHQDRIWVPLLTAVEYGQKNLVCFLLQQSNIDLSVTNNEKENALTVAARAKQYDIFHALVEEYDFKPSQPDRWRTTPLHLALSTKFSNSPHVALMLMAAGADTHATNESGLTPLQVGERAWINAAPVRWQSNASKTMSKTMQRLVAASEPTSENLEAASEGGLAYTGAGGLLDHPRAWGLLGQVLKTRSRHFTKSMLHEPSPMGESYLAYGMMCIGPDRLIATLRQHGLALSIEDFVTSEEASTEFLDRLLRDKNYGFITRQDVWDQWSASDIAKLSRAIPAEHRTSLPLRQIILSKERQEYQQRQNQPGRG